MENNLEMLENMMRPYFDKKEEIERIPKELEQARFDFQQENEDITKKNEERRSALETELSRLRKERERAINDFNEKREKEINDYIEKTLNSNSNFYSGYGSMIKEDLNKQYEKKLKEIEDRYEKRAQELWIQHINSMQSDKISKEKIEDLERKLKYNRVDLRELSEIKNDLRKKLYIEQKRLNFELRQQQINFDTTLLELTNFKYEYDENNKVINGAERRKIFDKCDNISDKIKEIKDSLIKVKEYLNLTELTKEETAALMTSMTHWEKEEYDRRKNSIMEDISSGKQIDDVSNDIVEIDDPVVSKYEEKDGNIVVDNMENLLKTIYNEIIEEAMKLSSVKLSESKGNLEKDEYYISSKEQGEDYQVNGVVNSIKLPCGEYLNSNDINNAIDNLYNRTKGRTYTVKSTGKDYKISKFTIEKLKYKLKKCVTAKLVKENKISKLDIFKVFGKRKANKVANTVEISKLDGIKVPTGDYINRNELITNLDNLFTTKKLDWLRTFSDKLKSKKDAIVEKLQRKKSDEDDYILEIDNDYRVNKK